MQWVFTLETDDDPIVPCRLLNVLRRKGVRISTFTMAAKNTVLSISAVFELPEESVEHIFNFLRRMEGVQHVAYDREKSSGDNAVIPS